MKSPILFFFFFLCFSSILFSQTYQQLQKIVASDRKVGATFGQGLAINGKYAVVGAQNDITNATGTDSLTAAGAVYVFKCDSNNTWHQEQKLVASDRQTSDLFGSDVAIDGNTIVVGAYDKYIIGQTNTYPHAGAIYIFERDTTTGVWNEVKKIIAPDSAAYNHFGYKVGISGNYIIAGSPVDSYDSLGNNPLSSSGSAFLIEKDNSGNWNLTQKICASDRATADLFGAALGISGNFAIITAYQEDEDSNGNNTLGNAGSAYLFKRSNTGHWYQFQKITSSDRDSGDRFGISTAIDSTHLIIGAYLEDDDENGLNHLNAAGSAYLFHYNGSQWSQEKKIIAPVRAANDYFGIAVHIKGTSAIVGAQNEATDAYGNNPLTSPGAAYIYKNDTNLGWHLLQKVTASDRASNDYFGTAVAIENDYALSSAYFEDEDENGQNTLSGAGSAYVFKYCAPTVSSIIINSGCNAYTSPSGQYHWNTTGIYSDTIINNQGCDSIITINLTVNNSHSSLTINTCSVYNSPSGLYHWNSTGIYHDTIPNMQGCDSLITVHLFINNSDTAINILACNSYTSPSGLHTWTSNGMYIDTIANSHSCDSIITVNLTIGNVSTSSTIYPTECSYYISPSGNSTWTAGGTYHDTIPNTQGCDSLITIHLTISNAISYSHDSVNSCGSYSSPSGVHIWNASGTYHDTISNSYGCDSIMTIYLTVSSIEASITQAGNLLISETAASSYQWLDCSNDYVAIPNATNPEYQPSNNGIYAVIVNNGICSDTSICYTISLNGIESTKELDNFSIFPNPVSSEFTIQGLLAHQEKWFKLELINGLGQKVYTYTNKTAKTATKNTITISTNDFNNGLYSLLLYTDSKIYSYQLIINK